VSDDGVTAAVGVLGLTVGFIIGLLCAANIARNTAVKLGHAHYEATSSGSSTFVWNDPITCNDTTLDNTTKGD